MIVCIYTWYFTKYFYEKEINLINISKFDHFAKRSYYVLYRKLSKAQSAQGLRPGLNKVGLLSRITDFQVLLKLMADFSGPLQNGRI